jgi:hypothetical protein
VISIGNVHRADTTVEAALGYAAGRRGKGVAFCRLATESRRHALRVPFQIAPRAPVNDRTVGYAALTEVAKALCQRGFRHVSFTLDDPQIVDEIRTHSKLDDTPVLAYVRVRCALNALDTFDVKSGTTDDLTQRARAEVALNLAA